MEVVFISDLKPFLDAVSEEMELYIPKKAGDHYIYSRFEPSAEMPVEFNDIRTCTPVKEFLLPIRELAASMPESFEPKDIKPFAVFGFKECDLRSIEILDQVFAEEEFLDPFYVARREKMFIISSDCSDVGETCFCNLFEGRGFVTVGFDLNVSKVRDGFIIEAGSKKGTDFIERNRDIFTDVPEALLAEKDENRSLIQKKLEQVNADFKLDATIKQIVENSEESEVFDTEAQTCIECQACTRVCPTCHCFYLYDSGQKDYFAKMKMWDSCMRVGYAAVAGGANPHKILGDRLQHRLLHKFVYYFDRYGKNMCVGCGRCVDADAGGMDIRSILKNLNAEMKNKGKKKTKAAK